MHYYQFHISDWAFHTSHLTLEEEAVYRRLLDHYYDTEKPIPLETDSVIRRLRLGSYVDIVETILDEFYTKMDDGWHNKRADKEIKHYQDKAERARNNGKLGGRPKTKINKKQEDTANQNPEETTLVISRNPEGTQTKANHKPITNNHKPETNSNNKHAINGVPYNNIKDLFHRVLPELRQVKIMGEARKATVRARWKKDLPTLQDWEKYFNYVRQSSFLMGQGPPNPGTGRAFEADFDWLIKPSNIIKVVEGKYHDDNREH